MNKLFFTILIGFIIIGFPLSAFADTMSFYPATGGGSGTSVDGWVYADTAGVSWATLRASAGTGADATTTANSVFYTNRNTGATVYYSLWRAIETFDTSLLPDDATITGATLTQEFNYKNDHLGGLPNLALVTSTPAANNNLQASDFNKLGITDLATRINYVDIITTSSNTFTLNALGLSVINKTGVTPLGIRNGNYDIDGASPPGTVVGNMDISGVMSEVGGADRPTLVIEYTTPSTGTTRCARGAGLTRGCSR